MKLKRTYLLIAAIAALLIAGIIIYRNLEATSLAGIVGENLKQASDRVILTVNGRACYGKMLDNVVSHHSPESPEFRNV